MADTHNKNKKIALNYIANAKPVCRRQPIYKYSSFTEMFEVVGYAETKI